MANLSSSFSCSLCFPTFSLFQICSSFGDCPAYVGGPYWNSWNAKSRSLLFLHLSKEPISGDLELLLSSCFTLRPSLENDIDDFALMPSPECLLLLSRFLSSFSSSSRPLFESLSLFLSLCEKKQLLPKVHLKKVKATFSGIFERHLSSFQHASGLLTFQSLPSLTHLDANIFIITESRRKNFFSTRKAWTRWFIAKRIKNS